MSNTLRGISSNSTISDTMQLANSINSNNNVDSSVSESFSDILNRQILNNYGMCRNVPTGKISLYTNTNSSNNSSSLDNTNDNITLENNYINIEDGTYPDLYVDIKAKDQDTKDKIANAVINASAKYNVDPNLILAVIQTESNFNPNVTSKAGAVGLMQVMPSNFKHLGISNGYDIEDNIDGGTKLLKEYIDKYNGSIEMALMAYNGGPTRMANRGVNSINDIYKMPKETQNYVPKVMNIYRGN